MMKNRFWIFVLIVATLALSLLFWRRPAQYPNSTEVPQRAGQSAAPPMVAASQNTTNALPPTLSANQHPSFTTNQMSLTEKIEEEVESRNKPIDFYGMVIDQNSNAVSGVEIKSGVRHWKNAGPEYGYVGATTIQLKTTTGADGRFELTGTSGDGIGIGITKDGYILSPKTPGGFAAESGSYSSPVIFKMWKKESEEQLIGGNHVFGIDSGKTYTLNLITGKKLEGEADGDLLVTITRPSDAKPRDKFPWSFSIQALQGGFVEPDPNDEFMYIAPESGYQPTIQMDFDTNNPDWAGVINKHLYFRSRNGQVYGSANIEIYSIYNIHSALRISYTLNPNGSRNLQP